MSVDELSALVEDRLAALDTVQSESEEELPVEPCRDALAEDFVPRSE